MCAFTLSSLLWKRERKQEIKTGKGLGQFGKSQSGELDLSNINFSSLVEVAGIEPASENKFPKASTCVFVVLIFTSFRSQRQDQKEVSSQFFVYSSPSPRRKTSLRTSRVKNLAGQGLYTLLLIKSKGR